MAIKNSLLLLFTLLSLSLLHSHCSSDHWQQHQSPKEDLSQCIASCFNQQSRLSLQHCQKECFNEYRERKPEEKVWMMDRESSEDESSAEKQNPFYFNSREFKPKFESEHGSIRVLSRFNKRSNNLQGIENYRLRFMLVNPEAVVLPHYTDAESIFFLVEGEGTLYFVWPQDQLQSFRMVEGQAIRVPVGAFAYLINHHENRRLRALELLIPQNIPGKFKEYYPVGPQNQQSYLTLFPKELMEAAYDTPWDVLESLFEPKIEGAVVKITRDQIQSLIQDSQSESKSKKHEISGPIDVANAQELVSNEYGRRVIARPEDHKQFRGVDISLSLINITRGGMTPPYYHSRSTKLVIVKKGEGEIFTVTPYLKNQQQGKQQGVQYQSLNTKVKQGDAFVLLAGHPVVILASPNSDLELISFGVRAEHDRIFYLAGRDNLWTQVQPALLDVVLGGPEDKEKKKKREIFKRQKEHGFVAGPNSQRQEKPRLVNSILEMVGHF